MRDLIDIDRTQIITLYANEKEFSKLFYYAYKNKDTDDVCLAKTAERFINSALLLLVNKPSDLLTCINGASKRKSAELLDFIIRHEYIDSNIFIFLGGDLELASKLPIGGWIEVPIANYCAYMINNTEKKLSIYELLPLYDIAPDDMKEYAFARGYESEKLDEKSIMLFKKLFPSKFKSLEKNLA